MFNLKKYIKASEQKLPYIFEEYENEAYHAGYDVAVDDELNLYFKCKENADMMPVITAKKTEEQGKVWYDLTLTFPKLDSSKFEYYDDCEYWVKKWYKVGEFVSYMQQHPYDPSVEYEEDE